MEAAIKGRVAGAISALARQATRRVCAHSAVSPACGEMSVVASMRSSYGCIRSGRGAELGSILSAACVTAASVTVGAGGRSVSSRAWAGLLGVRWRDCSRSTVRGSSSGARGCAHNAPTARVFCAYFAKFIMRDTRLLLADLELGVPNVD